MPKATIKNNYATKQDIIRIEGEIGGVKETQKTHFDIMIESFNMVYKKFDRVDEKFEIIDKRFERMDQRFVKMDVRFDEMDGRFDEMNQRFDLLLTHLGSSVMVATTARQ
jgi:predicted nuclease with TOPRIM domain